MYCRILNNLAVDVVGSFNDRFHSSLHSQFVDCPDNVQTGWAYDPEADTWAAPVIPEPEAEPEAEAEAEPEAEAEAEPE